MIYQHYQDQVKKSTEEIHQLNKDINKNSFARLFVIIGGGALLFYSFQWNNVPLVLVLMVGIVLLFVFLIRRQSRLEKKRADAMAFLAVNENELAVKDTRQNMYDGGQVFEDNQHPYTADLDIFGSFSLFALVNRAATQLGNMTLAAWFKSAASKSIIEERQEAVVEIADDIEWSQQFQARLAFNLTQKTEVKSFLARYFQDSGLAFGGPSLKLYVAAVPYIMLVLLLLSIFVFPLWPYVGTLALIHLLWTLRMAGKVSLFSSKIDKVGKVLGAYAEGLALVEQKSFKSSMTVALQEKLRVKDTLLSEAFRQLSSLIDNLDARNNMLVGALLNMFLLWDFKYVMKIVHWKSQYEANILVAFDVIAEFEALNTLAVLKRNQPEWTTPQILDQSIDAKLSCRHIAHPLIAAASSVENDYSSADHDIALITGSNMAGKSTFLRTVGINAVLAYAGAVCCASSLSLPIYHLISYMRIKDSLNESTSTFKAELDRMRFILQTVERDKQSLFLIDEMLRGTNSVDKYLGSRAIIRKLLAMEGQGMVATHDLQLATLEEEYPGKVQNYHFDIQVSEGEMLFDYKLKNGRCSIFNASMLLKGIGIDVDQA
ncbi:MutS-related protein [Sphingobacterium bambusae]|uniref:DNA mismatch repair protein MutS n=1 Tax=Sphingobacterium bambusae TaxID=662858 RepID=A0ABW6BF49_9SPHI|nr:DNA mismatch repair protein MutS [Sphingobacterium bambusae]WPL47635.1 DNA mismatch repair protein MutS [Sphingobacterium bambusae]